jgi:hypothetical protein
MAFAGYRPKPGAGTAGEDYGDEHDVVLLAAQTRKGTCLCFEFIEF